jgi:hypothetical protein
MVIVRGSFDKKLATRYIDLLSFSCFKVQIKIIKRFPPFFPSSLPIFKLQSALKRRLTLMKTPPPLLHRPISSLRLISLLEHRISSNCCRRKSVGYIENVKAEIFSPSSLSLQAQRGKVFEGGFKLFFFIRVT